MRWALSGSHGPTAHLTGKSGTRGAALSGLDSRVPPGHRLPAVRAEMLARAGRLAEAGAAFDEAIAVCGNDALRAHLVKSRARL